MSGVALLDVNVLVALFDPAHPHHERAHEWFGSHRSEGWATCAITQMGCVRVLSNPRYPSVRATVEQVTSHLRTLCASEDHVFWNCDLALVDMDRIAPGLIPGHLGITDTYLSALTVRNQGRLVTFDQALGVQKGAVGMPGERVVTL